MKFLVIIFLAFTASQSLAQEMESYPYCDGIGDEVNLCEAKRAQHFLGVNAKKVDDQVKLISKLFRESILTANYKPLASYINFPINFHITDFRGTELRKDAIVYTITINSLEDFTAYLIKLSNEHSDIFNYLKEGKYTKLYVNNTHIELISARHKIVLKTNKDLLIRIDAIFINIF